MDVEKTMEFILESQAKHESEIQAIRTLLKGGIKLLNSYQTKTNEKLAALIDAQLRAEVRLDRTDAQIAKLADAQAMTDLKLNRVADLQATTELKLQIFLDSLKNPKNGH
jgi:hypothetical protein